VCDCFAPRNDRFFKSNPTKLQATTINSGGKSLSVKHFFKINTDTQHVTLKIAKNAQVGESLNKNPTEKVKRPEFSKVFLITVNAPKSGTKTSLFFLLSP